MADTKVYLSGGRIQGRSDDSTTVSFDASTGLTYSGDMSSNWNQTDAGADFTIDTTNEEVDLLGAYNANNIHWDSSTVATLSTTAWTLRFAYQFTGTASLDSPFWWIGFSSHATVASNLTAQDFVGFGARVANGSTTFQPYLHATDNARLDQANISSARLQLNSSNVDLVSDNTIYYVEVYRDGDNFTVNVYSDSSYSTLLCTKSVTFAAVATLRYFIIANYVQGSGITGTFGVFKWWNGKAAGDVVTAHDKSSITNVQAGTRYEETDTRKIYRRVVGALENDTGLRFHYKFDEASGNVINYGSVASADLTVTGLTYGVSTPSGLGNGMSGAGLTGGDYAQNTSRVNDYKFMHDKSKWSVTFWLNLTQTPSTSSHTETMILGNIWTDDNGIGFCIRAKYQSASACKIQTLIADGNSGMPLNDNTGNDMIPDLNVWHFYCVTYDPTLSTNQLTITRDASTSGTGYHQGSEDNDTYSASNPTRKCTYFARPTGSYDGEIGGVLAQVMIFEDRILTQAEKLALYVGTAGTAGGTGTTKIASAWTEKGTA